MKLPLDHVICFLLRLLSGFAIFLAGSLCHVLLHLVHVLVILMAGLVFVAHIVHVPRLLVHLVSYLLLVRLAPKLVHMHARLCG